MTRLSFLSRTTIVNTDNPHVQLIVKPDYQYYMVTNAIGHFLSVIIVITTMFLVDIVFDTPETYALRTLTTFAAIGFLIIIAIPHACIAIRRVHTTAPHIVVGKIVHGYHHYYKEHP